MAPRLHGFLTRRLYNQIPDLEEALDRVEQHGVMDPLFPGSFSGYAHRPDDLREEVGAAGLAIDDLVNVEGLAFALPDLAERMSIAADRDAVHGLLRRRPVW